MAWNPARWFSSHKQLGLEPPAPVRKPAPGERVARSVPVFDRTRGVASIDPAGIQSRFTSADIGRPADMCDLFERTIERDGHLRSVYENRIIAVAGKAWIVQAGGKSPEDVKAAELLQDALRAIPNFRETMLHLLMAPAYGYSAAEIVWDVRGGIFVPTEFAIVPHRRFRFTTSDEMRLLTADNRTDGVELEPGKWIVHRAPGRISAAAGYLRTATWWSFFKKLAVGDWIVLCERFGIPYVTGQWKETASEADKEILKQAVANLGKDGAAAFSDACQIVLNTSSGGKAEDVQGALTNLCNAELSKLVLGATLTSGEGSSAGSYALGRVHQDARFDIIQGDEQMLGDAFERDVGARFVEFNEFKAKPPRVKVYVTRDVDPLTDMKILSIAANELGMSIDGEQVRQRFNIKKPDEGGEVLTGTRAGGEVSGGDGIAG